MILTKTPYRVSLFGGGTDYPGYFNQHGGAVLGMAINKYCYVGVKDMPPGQELSPGVPLRFRVQYSKVDDCNSVDEIKHPAVRGALQYFAHNDPTEVHCFGDLPGRSGLGGSSSFTVGLVHALRAFGLGRPALSPPRNDAWNLADEAIHIEQEVIKEAVGCQDQVFAAHGGLLYVTFDQNQRTIRRLDLPAERKAELEYCLVLAFTGTMRDAHTMAARQVAKINDNRSELAEMKELAALGLEALTNHRTKIDTIGLLLHRAWHVKSRLCDGISNLSIDALYSKGLDSGAIGGKLLGAGGGGFMLFYVPISSRSRFNKYMADVPTVPFRISQAGSRVIIQE